MIGHTLSHYEVLEKLGEGGMGVVYRARDVRLNRPVAIKVLPHDAMADPDRARRFMQEARAASALNHPHIVTVYEVDASNGTDFIVMEYVAGSTLERLIGQQGLTLNDALKYGAQVADALAAAHRAGIVHRDLKPGNVMITERGDAKVLDFGLAKLTESADADALDGTTQMDDRARTEAGTILGTVAYMSPEQAEGKKVDARSDIFSFGSLLYEMVTGRRAFQGETKMSTLSAILQTDPPPASAVTKRVPRELDGIIAHCLRKDPDRRFQHLDDVKTLLDGLRETSAATGGLRRHDTRGGTRRRVPLVIAATVLVLAAITGVTWWLTRDRTPGAAAPPPSRLTSGGPPSSNAEANRYFETAMQTKVGLDIPRTRQMLDRALELDPHFAEARAWRAFTTWLILDGGHSNDSALLNQAEAEMRRALQDDPTLARAHVGIASVYLMQGRRELMPAELDQALKTNPGDEDTLHMLMHYHQHSGEYATAQRVAQQILDRLPLFWPTRMIVGEMLREQGDLAGAIREQDKILEQDPQNAYALGYLARAHMESGNLISARRTLDRARPEDRQGYRARRTLAILLALEGKRAEAIKAMDEDVLKWAALLAYETSEVADFYAVLGDVPRALDWLDRAVRSGDERAEYFRRNPLLASIRDDPRFEQILQSIAYRRQQRTTVR